MGLVPEFDRLPDPSVSQIDIDLAGELRKVLTNTLRRSISMKSWAKSISLLRTADKISDARINAVIKWFTLHHQDSYVPTVHSARGFRSKFLALESSMKRDEAVPISIKITDVARQIQNHLGLQWPEGTSKTDELPMIQASLDFYTDFRRRLNQRCLKEYNECCRAQHTKVGRHSIPLRYDSKVWRVYHVLRHLELHAPRDPILYIESHVREVHGIAWNWDKWKGNLKARALSVESKWFNTMMTKIIKTYCGRGDEALWKEIKEKIYEGSAA